MVLLWTGSPSQAYEMTAEELIARFKEVRNLFFEKYEQGYELDEAIALVPDLKMARRLKDWDHFITVLEQIATELENASLPGSDPPPGDPPPYVGSLHFGVEIARPDVAPQYTEIGATWINIGLVHWDFVEQSAPEGDEHTYSWYVLDLLVNHWQSNGFTGVHFVVSPRCAWAAESEPSSPESATPIKEEYLDDFGLFMQAMVERYDGDGVDDMPGLVAPVKYYEIGQEMQHSYYWEGTVEQYRQVLESGYNGVKAADSDSLVILSGINMGEMFDDCPSPEVLEFRFANLNPDLAAAVEFIKTTFTYNQWFDVVEFHYNYDYKGGHGTVKWMREQMALNGYQKPIWIGDAAGGPMVDSILRTPAEADELYEKLSNPEHPEHEATVAWFEREQAMAFVKKSVISMELDLEGIILANLIDWPGYTGGRSWEFQGLRNDDGTARPAFTACTNTVAAIGSMNRIERLTDYGNSVFAYRVSDGENEFYILWSSSESESWNLALDVSSVRVSSPVPDEMDEEEMQVLDGNVNLLLTEVPIFVELGVE